MRCFFPGPAMWPLTICKAEANLSVGVAEDFIEAELTSLVIELQQSLPA